MNVFSYPGLAEVASQANSPALSLTFWVFQTHGSTLGVGGLRSETLCLFVQRRLWNHFSTKLFSDQPLWQVLFLPWERHIRPDCTWPWSWNEKIGPGLCHWVLLRSPQLYFHVGWRIRPYTPSTILAQNVIVEGEVCWTSGLNNLRGQGGWIKF